MFCQLIKNRYLELMMKYLKFSLPLCSNDQKGVPTNCEKYRLNIDMIVKQWVSKGNPSNLHRRFLSHITNWLHKIDGFQSCAYSITIMVSAIVECWLFATILISRAETKFYWPKIIPQNEEHFSLNILVVRGHTICFRYLSQAVAIKLWTRAGETYSKERWALEVFGKSAKIY